MSGRGRASRLALILALAGPAPALQAQDPPCDGGQCALGLRAAESTLGAIMLAAGGGNPWLGSASTLGFRTVTFPRIGLQARAGFARAEVPGDEAGRNDGVTPLALNGGIAMAIFDGFAPAATVGGVGSVDVFGNAGVVFLSDAAGFGTGSPFTWSLGARIGVFRESFTLPGVTASIAYRGVGEVNFDRAAVLSRDAGFSWRSASAWQARGVVGKRLAAFALSGGIGWDGAGADVSVASRNLLGATVTDDLRADADRWHTFVDLTWTSLILSFAVEAGWQFGAAELATLGDRDPAAGGRPFGAIGGRVTF